MKLLLAAIGLILLTGCSRHAMTYDSLDGKHRCNASFCNLYNNDGSIIRMKDGKPMVFICCADYYAIP